MTINPDSLSIPFDRIYKLKSILLEYSMRKTQNHVGSGLGGNILYFAYTNDKESIITEDVADVDIRDNKILWNPAFLLQSKLEIRNRLDALLKENIEREEFKFPINDNDDVVKFDEALLSDTTKNLNVDDVLFGNANIPDLSKLDTLNKLYLCARLCDTFSMHLTNNNPDVKKCYGKFLDSISRFDATIALIAIRLYIQLSTIINYNLDEDEFIGPLLREINRLVDISWQ